MLLIKRSKKKVDIFFINKLYNKEKIICLVNKNNINCKTARKSSY